MCDGAGSAGEVGAKYNSDVKAIDEMPMLSRHTFQHVLYCVLLCAGAAGSMCSPLLLVVNTAATTTTTVAAPAGSD
jgi:hypothetical protein